MMAKMGNATSILRLFISCHCLLPFVVGRASLPRPATIDLIVAWGVNENYSKSDPLIASNGDVDGL